MAKTSFGAELWIHDGSTLVKVADLNTITPPKPQRGTIDTTAHDTTPPGKTFIGEATYDPGEISVQGNYIAGSTGDDLMTEALNDGDNRDWKIVVKAASGTEDITSLDGAIMTQYGPDGFEVDGKQTFSATLKVSGALTQAASA
jgi:predicted secreted protein